MADYDLGTAHGKIKVDYDDKGFKAADKDMSELSDKSDQMATAMAKARAKIVKQYQAVAEQAKTMAGMVGAVRQKFGGDLAGMADKSEAFVGSFAKVVGLVGFSVGVFSRAGQTMETLGGAMGIVDSLGLAMGGVPEGAENFPETIRNIIRLAASIALFRGSMFLLAGLAARFRGLAFASPLLRGLGSSFFALSAPLQLVSRLALDVAFAIREFRFIKQIAKWVLLATGAFAGLGGAIWIVTGLAQAIAQLVGVAGLLPGVLVSAGLAFGTAKLGMKGFFDAIKSGDMSSLSEEAAKAAGMARTFRRVWGEMQQAVQNRMFQGVSKDVNDLGMTYMPIMHRGMVGIAGALNHGAREAAGFFRTASAQRDVNTMFMNTQGTVRNLMNAVRPLIQVFLDVATVASGMLQEMTMGAGESARSFADMVREARESGKLREWIQGGVDAVKDLWGFLKSVGRIMGTIFSGLNGGEDVSFLQRMREGAERVEAFLKSAEGQEILGMLGDAMEKAATNVKRLADAFRDYILPAIKPFIPIAQAVSDAIMDGLVNAIAIVAPMFQAIGTAMAPLSPLIGFIVQGMAQMTFVIMGLFLVFKLLGAFFLIFNSGLRAVRGALAVAGFAFRLFTGTLRGGELAALRFMWALIKSIGRGIATWIAGIARGIAANVVWLASVIRTAIVTAAQWIWAKTVVIAQWIAMKIAAIANAIATAAVWVAQTIWARIVIIANWVAIRTALFLIWLVIKIQALASAIAVGLAWLAQTIITRAQLVAAWIVTNAQVAATWVLLKIQAAAAAIATGAAWLAQAIVTRAQLVAAWVATRVQLFIVWASFAIQAAASAIAAGAAWLVQTAITTSTIVAQWIVARAVIIAGWIAMAAQATISAAMMAAAWLYSVWPVALVIAIIVGLVALIIYNWDTIVAATQKAWEWVSKNVIDPVNEFVNTVRQAVGRFVLDLLQKWNNFVNDTRAAFERWKSDTKRKIDEVIRFFQELPGKVVAFLRGLPGQLMILGGQMVQGLMNGLRSLGDRIRNFIMEKAKAAWEAVKSFFGIASPSRLMMWAGEMIGLGWIKGLRSMGSKVADEARTMAVGVQAAIEGPVAAAMEALKAMGEGKKVFEDFTFKGGSANLGKYNDDLVDAMRASGIRDPKKFLEQYVANAAKPAAAKPAPVAPPTFRTTRATGGDGATAPTNIIESVTIDARSVAEMNSVVEFFDKVQQKARAGNGGA